MLRRALLLLLLPVVPGCVSVQNVDDSRLPSDWSAAIATVDRFRDPSGTWPDRGEGFGERGVVGRFRLVDVFFGGRFRPNERVDAVELRLVAADRLVVRARRGDAVVAEREFPVAMDRAGGWTTVRDIPVADTEKFGAVASTREARLGLAADGTLYAWTRLTGVGVVLFLPAAGERSDWVRWRRPAAD
jgi:hypothetical protein